MSDQDRSTMQTPNPDAAGHDGGGAAVPEAEEETVTAGPDTQDGVETEEISSIDPGPAASDDPAANEEAPADGGGELIPTPEAYEAQIEELRHNWLRALADFDNLRKRTTRDIEAARARDRGNILRSFLDVLDNLERALAAGGGEENRWVQGVEAIRRQMLDIFRNFGAQPFESKGQPFDATRHEAVATANLPDQPEGIVIEVVQEGYVLGESTILRPAKVVVVRHG